MKPNYPNMHKLAQSILEHEKYPGLVVINDLDADSGEHTPVVSWTVINGGQQSYGLWSVILALTVLCVPSDMDELLPHLYAQVVSWNEPGVGILAEDQFGVETVTDMGVFDATSQGILNGKHVLQFNAQFRLNVRDWS